MSARNITPLPGAFLATLLILAACLPAAALGADAAASDSIATLQQFFKGQESRITAPAIDFEVTGGFADIATDRKESAGRYFLVASHITRLTGDIYRLDLAFAKRLEQDIVDFSPGHYFTENRTYYFWYNTGDRSVFKVGPSRVTVPVTRKEITRVDIQSMETYSVDRQKLFKDLSLVHGNTTITLQIRFK